MHKETFQRMNYLYQVSRGTLRTWLARCHVHDPSSYSLISGCLGLAVGHAQPAPGVEVLHTHYEDHWDEDGAQNVSQQTPSHG